MGTKNKPGQFDCYANALDDEPMFVLLARDKKAAQCVRQWAAAYENEKTLGNKPMTPEQYSKWYEAIRCADAMEEWNKNFHNQRRVEQQKNTFAAKA